MGASVFTTDAGMELSPVEAEGYYSVGIVEGKQSYAIVRKPPMWPTRTSCIGVALARCLPFAHRRTVER
jgi:hypothetical protein